MMYQQKDQYNQEIAEAEKELRKMQQKEKILKNQVQKLTRKERTNRLCTRAGMLESFLGRPELLSNEQVMELLRVAFCQEEVREVLKLMLETAERENP